MKYKTGDLIAAAQNEEVGIIAHQCNCHIAMGRGIAPLIKRAFPSAWEADQATVKSDPSKLGTFSLGVEKSGLHIFNLYGQYDYAPPKDGKINTDYHSLDLALCAMRTYIEDHNLTGLPIGFPKLGCGYGGGDWVIVSRMIFRIFRGLDVTIYEL